MTGERDLKVGEVIARTRPAALPTRNRATNSSFIKGFGEKLWRGTSEFLER